MLIKDVHQKWIHSVSVVIKLIKSQFGILSRRSDCCFTDEFDWDNLQQYSSNSLGYRYQDIIKTLTG